MDDHLISGFIDDELDLSEKISFVEGVSQKPSIAKETLDLLEQEQLLQGLPLTSSQQLPATAPNRGTSTLSIQRLWRTWWQGSAGFATGAILIYLGLFFHQGEQPTTVMDSSPYRFVLYLPEVSQASIVGTFTDWTPVAMQPTGGDGYWSISIPVTPGEHRYSYLLENKDQIPDPTIETRELDDFGGENSVIIVGGNYDPIS